MDPTDLANYGQQQELSFFNGHYDNYCYLPMLGFLTFNDEPDQYLFAAVLRSGKATAKLGYARHPQADLAAAAAAPFPQGTDHGATGRRVCWSRSV